MTVDLDLSSLTTTSSPLVRRGPFTVLMVCTGNICRSAFAAALLEQTLVGRVPVGAVVVESAGTDVAPALEMPPMIRRAVEETGADPDAHRATPLEPQAIAGADLIVTMTRRQRAEVARRSPRSAASAVTLAELARLVSAGPAGAAEPLPGDAAGAARSLRDTTRSVLRRRGMTPGAADEDIVDPWQRSDAVYAESIARIRGHVATIADGLTGVVA